MTKEFRSGPIAIALVGALVGIIVFGASSMMHMRSSHGQEATPPAESEMTPRERLAADQEAIAQRFAHLEAVLLRMASLIASTNAQRATLVRQTVAESKRRLVAARFDALRQLLRSGDYSSALRSQTILVEDLAALLELLERETRADENAARQEEIRQLLKELGRLVRREQSLRAQTDGPQSSERLAQQQGDIREDTQRMAEQMQGKDASPPPSQDADAPSDSSPDEQSPPSEGDMAAPAQNTRAAEEAMQRAQKALESDQRDQAREDQQEAIDRLLQSQAELEEILRQLREEEIEQMLLKLEARIDEMLQREKIILAQAREIHEAVTREPMPDLDIATTRLSGEQTKVRQMADAALLLLREDGTSIAMPEALQAARDDMVIAAQQLDGQNVGPVVQTMIEEIIAALQDMKEAVEKAKQEAKERREGKSPPPPSPQEQGLVDRLAELKMLRSMQARIHRQTTRYGTLLGESGPQDDALRAAIQTLAARQESVARIARDLAAGKNE